MDTWGVAIYAVLKAQVSSFEFLLKKMDSGYMHKCKYIYIVKREIL